MAGDRLPFNKMYTIVLSSTRLYLQISLESDGEMKNNLQQEKRLVTWLLGSYSLTLYLKRLNLGDTMEYMKEVKVVPHDYELE